MPLDTRNLNTLWTSVLVETLYRLGLRIAVVCPGSRSAPLTIAFAQHPDIQAIPVLDERSAAFFALGLSRRSGLPTVLVCTSGTAGANFFPAIVEARMSQVPLLVLTADRPPELRDCHAGQAIDQVKLYGHYPNWQTELALPELHPGRLSYLRQTMIYAWERSLFPIQGAVHLNCPFRDPLTPVLQPDVAAWAESWDGESFFECIPTLTPRGRSVPVIPWSQGTLPMRDWLTCDRGLIVAGPAQPRHPQDYCQGVAQLSKLLQWPVLAEGLSPLRNYGSLNPHLVSTYDIILRNSHWRSAFRPEQVIQLGELPTSKELRTWLEEIPCLRWVLDPSDQNFDPLHGKTVHLRHSIADVVDYLQAELQHTDRSDPSDPSDRKGGSYLKQWLLAQGRVQDDIDRTLASLDTLFEGKVAWLLARYLPERSSLFIANSTPVRDVEWFWGLGDRGIQIFFNRGANGIDGTLSTALGVAYQRVNTVLLTGDLAFLHDTNGLLLAQKFRGHLTVIVINNQGGGIFELLPIRQWNPPFEEFFATPQRVDLASLCASYGISHLLIEGWDHFLAQIQVLPTQGIRVLEIRTDRAADARWRQNYFSQKDLLDFVQMG